MNVWAGNPKTVGETDTVRMYFQTAHLHVLEGEPYVHHHVSFFEILYRTTR
jgi:hypothetical protein